MTAATTIVRQPALARLRLRRSRARWRHRHCRWRGHRSSHPGEARRPRRNGRFSAGRMGTGKELPDFDVTEAALQHDGPVLAAPWWKRAALSGVDSLPSGPAIYCIYDGGAREPEPAYVGET